MTAPPGAGWPIGTAGVLVLPSGRTVRGRGLRRPLPDGPAPEFGVYLGGGAQQAPPAWPSVHLRWPDFWLPRDRAAAGAAIVELHRRAAGERVEVGCRGGVGRTGTVLACCAVLDGLDPDAAVAFVRERYHRRAVETPSQRRYVTSAAAGPGRRPR